MKATDTERFILAHGNRVPKHHLAAVVGESEEFVDRLMRTRAFAKTDAPKSFAQLFLLWHGREPVEADWPAPRWYPRRGSYEMQAPECALIASLIGVMGTAQIAEILTTRLRKVTGARRAKRTRMAVQSAIQRMGLQSSDVVGGVTIQEAGREIGSPHIVVQAINSKTLRSIRKGKHHVIPHDEWARWKGERTPPPKGYVQLSSIREQLSIRSDSKLPEFASCGYIPGAILCRNPHSPGVHSSGRGSWYIDAKVARQLVRDRRAGRKMPWHGKPMRDNLKATYKLWLTRKHPRSCEICAKLWGAAGPPKTLEDYSQRYPPLAFGAKRHLTRMWTLGLSVQQVAALGSRTSSYVHRAIRNGVLEAERFGQRLYVTRTEATRWKARGCPTGDGYTSWISLAWARKSYMFTLRELRALIAAGKLRTRTGTEGTQRGVTYVLRQQCRNLRDRVGYSEQEAARLAHITIPKLREVLEGVDWRGADGIPFATVQAVIKRLETHEGYSLREAASKLRAPIEWVQARAKDGTIRMRRSKKDARKLIITDAMLRRLREIRARRRPSLRENFGPDWLNRTQASLEAGVSLSTMIKWEREGDLKVKAAVSGPRIQRRSLRTKARSYWKTVRFLRKTPPAWITEDARLPANHL